jgi:hypothetical protein
MANDKAAPAFMDLPLEVRHTIFEHVAARDVNPKKLLRYWFEKKEMKELVAQEAIDNPNGPTPRVVYGNDDYDDYDDESAVADDDSEHDGDEENENAAEDSENEDEDENEDENGNQGAEQEEDSDGDEDEAEIHGDGGDEEPDEAVDGAQNTQSATTGVHVPTQATAQVGPSHQPAGDMEEHSGEVTSDEGEGNEGEGDEGVEGTQTNTGAEVDDDSEGEGEGDDANTAATVAATQPLPPAPVFRPQNKWRHIPNFMRLTHCPPPVQLLLTSKQLNNEAKNWFYDVAILRIDATGSFAHTSFFEEAFSQITDAAFSPMENIRKVDITFVWDSAWIRADTTDCIGAVFPALLRQRSSFVYSILLQAPDLREVVIHW